jgi:hypothetical protein
MADEYVLDTGQSLARWNLLRNGSFEEDTAGWTATTVTLARTTSSAYTGTASGEVTATGTSAFARIVYQVDFEVGSPFRASCWVKNTSGATRNHRIGVQFTGASTIFGADTSVTAGGDWTYLEVTGTIPATATAADVRVDIQNSGGAIGNKTLVDGVMFEMPSPGFTAIPADTFYFGVGDLTKVPNTVSNARLKDSGIEWVILAYEKFTSAVQLQTAQVFLGRRDDISASAASSGSFGAWYPTGFSSPDTNLAPGNAVRLRRVGKTAPLWQGRIRDVRVAWNLPWDGTTGNGDQLTIEAEGYLGGFGRSATEGVADFPVGFVFEYLLDFLNFAEWVAPVGYDPTLADSTGQVTSDAELVDVIATTFSASIQDGNPTVRVTSGNYYADTTAVFSDVANDATHRVFEEIEYSSLADDYLRRIQVDSPNASAFSEAVNAYGRDATFTTLSYNDDAAIGLVDDLIDRYGEAAFRVTSVACRAEAQHTMNLDGLDSTDPWNELIGKRTEVTFRGTNIKVRIQGVEFVASPETALYRYFFSAENPVEYLILDSSDYGVLDTNRLGW